MLSSNGLFLDPKASPYADKGVRQRIQQRVAALKLERATFIPHYQELGRFIQPRKGRYDIFDRDKGGDRFQAIINSHATFAWRTARSGLLAGSMNPSHPWFTLQTIDPGMMTFKPVQIWLYQVEQILREIMQSSNFYAMVDTMLGEVLLFATGFMSHVEDFEDVARFYTYTAGSYMIGHDDRQVVNTMAREFMMTTRNLVEKFGLKNVSYAVENAYSKGNYDGWWPVTHMIEPNAEFDPSGKLSQQKKFVSVYFEWAALDQNITQVASVKGFDEFPGYGVRWETTAEDIYGTNCPAMVALGDTKALQIEERRKAQGIDKMVNPPLKGPSAVRNVPIDSLPGGLTVYDMSGDGKGAGLSTLYQVNPQLQELRLDMKAVEDRIDNAFYMHLWRAISDMKGIQPRNELELTQRDQERLLELGPVLTRLHDDLHKPLIDRLFKQALRAGILPPVPPALKGKALKVKYISALDRAQNSVAAGTIERNTTFIAGLVTGGFPDAAHKVDVMAVVDEYARITGLPPRLLLSNAQVMAAIQQQQQQIQAQQNAQAGESAANIGLKGAQAVQALAKSPSGGDPLKGDNVLKAIQRAVQYRGNPNLFVQGQPPGPPLQ